MNGYERSRAFLELGVQNVRESLRSMPHDAPEPLKTALVKADVALSDAAAIVERGWIRCPKCSMVSYHSSDVMNRYCSNCAQFHRDMEKPA